MIEIKKSFRFEAAHWLPKTAVNHKCHRLHGHNFVVIMSFVGHVGDDGMLMDFAVITEAWNTIKAMVDHRLLNEIEGLENPTSEVLAVWIWRRIVALIPSLAAVEVKENDDSGAVFRGA